MFCCLVTLYAVVFVCAHFQSDDDRVKTTHSISLWKIETFCHPFIYKFCACRWINYSTIALLGNGCGWDCQQFSVWMGRAREQRNCVFVLSIVGKNLEVVS